MERAIRETIRITPKNTSKTCSKCGHANRKLKLGDRVLKCPAQLSPVCGLEIDRDQNASINILNRGLESLTNTPSSGHGEYRRKMA